jgi:hypothetical protein
MNGGFDSRPIQPPSKHNSEKFGFDYPETNSKIEIADIF